MSRFAVWAASDAQRVAMAKESVQSVRKRVPGITTVLLSSAPAQPGFDWLIRMDKAPEEPWMWYYYRVDWYIKALDRLPLDSHVLFLDTDIYIVEPIEDVFALLDKFDLLGVHNCRRRAYTTPEPVPDAFCDINCGFLALSVNWATRMLFDDWRRIMQENNRDRGEPNDQPSFRQALWNWEGRLYVMPPEYNIQWRQGGFASGRVKVLHGESQDYRESARWINAGGEMRTWTAQQAR